MSEESISIVKIHDIALATIPNNLDDEGILNLQIKVLNFMKEKKVTACVLNISLVDMVDSFFARSISEMVQMLELMGCRVVISGMRPNVAIAITELGLTLSKIKITLNLENALDLLKD